MLTARNGTDRDHGGSRLFNLVVVQVYEVVVSREADESIMDIYRYIAFEIMQPLTAIRYIKGIRNVIRRLSRHGGMFAVSLNDNLRRRYGTEVRTVVYKKMTVVYTLMNNVVFVHCVIPGSMIK